MSFTKNYVFFLILLSLNSYSYAEKKSYICEQSKTEQSLIWALDISSSMNAEEFKTQVDGYIAALKDKAVQDNFLHCQCSEVAVVFWAEQSKIKYDFKQMKDEKSINDLIQFFQNLTPSDYSLGSLTDLYQVLQFSGEKILGRINDQQSPKLAITISGDGMNKHTDPKTISEFRMLKQSLYDSAVRINGVPVVIYQYADIMAPQNMTPFSRNLGANPYSLSNYKDVADFYSREIITPNGYLQKADTFADFARAIKNSILQDSCSPMM